MSLVAVVQATPVPYDSMACAKHAVDLIAECGSRGAQLAVFPEAFIGGYPKGLNFGCSLANRTEEGRIEYARYSAAAVALDGPEVTMLTEAAAAAGIFVVIGVVEKRGNTLYCTILHIDPGDGIVGLRRKIMPTAAERLVWGFGDGSTIKAVDSPAGRIGTVVCWENYMPLLRYSMYAQDIDVYCAPTLDDRDSWIPSMKHIAMEGRVHVLSACPYLTRADYPEDYPETIGYAADDTVIRGGSAILDPMGNILAGPVYGRTEILMADIEPDTKTRSHLDFDAVGHYARPDIFRLHVDTEHKDPVTFG